MPMNAHFKDGTTSGRIVADTLVLDSTNQVFKCVDSTNPNPALSTSAWLPLDMLDWVEYVA